MKSSKRLSVMGRGQSLLNNGFTLIELLAVLIVLAIVAVIAVPIVLNIIKETKEKSYDISVENVMRVAKIYDLESELTDTPIGMDVDIYDDEFIKRLSGTKPDTGNIYIKPSMTGEKKEIAFALQYGQWCYTKAYGDPTYEKKKTNQCNVPFDYLMFDETQKTLDGKTGHLTAFLKNEFGITREQIESITTVSSSEVPLENKEQSWDVSQDQTGKVMAWYEDIDNNGYYEIYIGQNGGIKANSNSLNLFAYLSNVKSIDLTYFDTSQVENMNGMFLNCKLLSKLNVGHFDTSKVGTDKQKQGSMSSMFLNCSGLTTIDVSNWNVINVKNLQSIFSGCSGLTSLDISKWDTSNVTNMAYMFNGCSSLTSLDVSNFETKGVLNMEAMFNNCSKVKKIDVSGFDTSDVTSMYAMFSGCSQITSLDVSNFETKGVKRVDSMFSGCSLLTSLDVSGFDTSDVTTMDGMFRRCSKLENIDVSNFDTSKVTRINDMFNACSSLKSIDISHFDVSGVTSLKGMFAGCSSLKELKFKETFDTSNINSMESMFQGCTNLETLDVSYFDTSNVTNMQQMFQHLPNLKQLDLSSFDTSKVTNMYAMFEGTTRLKPIYVGEKWLIGESTIVTRMFDGATKNVDQLCYPDSTLEWCVAN